MLIAEAISGLETPENAYGIHRRLLEAGVKVDLVSVYRSLEVMLEAGLVHFVPAKDGYLPCRLTGHDDPVVQHVVCDSCGKVQEVRLPDCASDDVSEQLEKIGFLPRRVLVQVEGTCIDCQKAQ